MRFTTKQLLILMTAVSIWCWMSRTLYITAEGRQPWIVCFLLGFVLLEVLFMVGFLIWRAVNIYDCETPY